MESMIISSPSTLWFGSSGLHLMKTVISHYLQKTQFGSYCSAKCLLLFIPAQWSFQSSETFLTISWLITTGGNFFGSRVRSRERVKQHWQDACHLKQEELVLCNQFYNSGGETDYPPGGSAATGIFWSVMPDSSSVRALCQLYFRLPSFQLQKCNFP